MRRCPGRTEVRGHTLGLPTPKHSCSSEQIKQAHVPTSCGTPVQRASRMMSMSSDSTPAWSSESGTSADPRRRHGVLVELLVTGAGNDQGHQVASGPPYACGGARGAVGTHRHHLPVARGAVTTDRQTLSLLTDKATLLRGRGDRLVGRWPVPLAGCQWPRPWSRCQEPTGPGGAARAKATPWTLRPPPAPRWQA